MTEATYEFDYASVDISIMRDELAQLPQRTQDIVSMRFGLDTFSPCTLKKCGQAFNLSQTRIDHITRNTVYELRRRLFETCLMNECWYW